MINGLDVDSLKETCGVVKKDPKLAQSKFRVHNTWKEGGHNKVRVLGYYAAGDEKKHKGTFSCDADEPVELAGTDAGPNPVEYLLTALSGCMTTTIIYHASLKGITFKSMESDFEGDLDIRGLLNLEKSIPIGFQKIRATFKVKTDAPVKEFADFYKFSPVYNMVSKAVPIEVKYEKV